MATVALCAGQSAMSTGASVRSKSMAVLPTWVHRLQALSRNRVR